MIAIHDFSCEIVLGTIRLRRKYDMGLYKWRALRGKTVVYSLISEIQYIKKLKT